MYCQKAIYHTAPGGHWTHRDSEDRKCGGDFPPNYEATPKTRKM